MVSSCLAVNWLWALMALLSMAGACIPQDRYEPAPSIEIASSLWIVLVHPGATNSSGVVMVVAKAVRQLFRALHKWETDRDRKKHEELDENQRPAEFQPPLERTIIAGGASMAVNGLIMSQEQNRSAGLAVECEVEGVLHWFRNESSVDRGAPGKLWDGADWTRPVLDKSKAFTCTSPWFGIFSGGHVPELYQATQTDHFGLRKRLTCTFAIPE